MIQILKDNWEKYKELETWKQILLFVPLILLVILCISLFFINPRNNKYIDQVKANKGLVDKQIEINKKEQDKLNELEKKVIDKQKELKEQSRINYEEAKKLGSRISTAVDNNDADELKRIHTELNRKSRKRTITD